MSEYLIVEDSHRRRFLKEEGYGFIAEVLAGTSMRDAFALQPLNKGTTMSRAELLEALSSALEAINNNP